MATTTMMEAMEIRSATNGTLADAYELFEIPPKGRDGDRLSNVPDETTVSYASEARPPSKLQIVMTILQPSLINFFGSFTTGIVTVGLPAIAKTVALERSLYLWPSSVYSLTSGAGLLIAGSIADIVGARHVDLYGIFLISIFILACGFAQTGTQLVVFRALQGIGLAMHIPASVSIVSNSVPAGRARNIGFGCLGLSQPLGFSFGMVASGIMIETIGWRSGFYLAGGGTLIAAIASWITLPKVKGEAAGLTLGPLLKKLWNDVDWVGATIASSGLSLLSYVLAMISADLSIIRSATTASLLAVSIILLIAFPLWMWQCERNGRPALVPNSLWKNIPFTSICGLVALSFGTMNSMELFSSLYFQEVQNHSTLTTSLYLLPNLIVGVCINLSVGVFVDRLPAGWLVVISSLLCTVAPLMMALVNPVWKYYYVELWAQMLAPLSADVLYTVGLLIVSGNFPQKTQALAGAVFSTVAQFGTALGVGVCQVVALGVMGTESENKGKDSTGGGHSGSVTSDNPADLLRGYRAGFWTMFALMACCVFIAIAGLRQTGKVGLKKD